jgi:hypothetical protein
MHGALHLKFPVHLYDIMHTVHRSQVDLCRVQMSLVQCRGSTKHAGGWKTSYWSAIRRHIDSYPNCKRRAGWKHCNSLVHLFL